MKAQDAFLACRARWSGDDQALTILKTLSERGSLQHMNTAGFQALTPALAQWLLRAESHAGSELVFINPEHKVRALPLNSYFNFPDRYTRQMPHGAYLSAEIKNGQSVVTYLLNCERKGVLDELERIDKEMPLSTTRPLRERILDKLRDQGHLSYLSKQGLENLDSKLIKYLDYAANVRPGSEIIYRSDTGYVNGDDIEKVIRRPEKFAELPRPVYLAIEVDDQSVIFDTNEVTPTNIWRLMKKARQVVKAKI
jgi:hypothetical protein